MAVLCGMPTIQYSARSAWLSVRLSKWACPKITSGFTASQIRVLCANFVTFGRPKIGKVVRYLPDTKKSARSLALAFARITPKSAGQRQTVYSQCPKFHPNRFTSGGVIAERVNTVQSRTKCFQYSAKLQLLRRVISHKYNNNNSPGDLIANVNFLRRHRTCRGKCLRPLNRLPNFYYK